MRWTTKGPFNVSLSRIWLLAPCMLLYILLQGFVNIIDIFCLSEKKNYIYYRGLKGVLLKATLAKF